MIRLAGQADLKAWATAVEPWAGLLFWQDGTATATAAANNPVAMIDVQGHGSMDIAGTIYAPQGAGEDHGQWHRATLTLCGGPGPRLAVPASVATAS